MTAASALLHLRHRSMSWLAGNLFSPAAGWLWRRLNLIWRCLVALSRRALPRSVQRLALPWTADGGNEAGAEEQEVGVPPEDVEGSRGSGPERRTPGREEDRDEFGGEEYRVGTADELYCDYDSTWETEQGQESGTFRRSSRSGGHAHYKFSRFQNAARDMQNYRHDYPNRNRMQPWTNHGQDDTPNLSFYLGRSWSLPDGLYISDFHEGWRGRYDALESVHTYIQWLFPLQEPGMNHEASTLTRGEIELFVQDTTAKGNLLRSYKLMLDFYGIELVDEGTGAVRRAHNWRERFSNLNRRTHNNLRITRILKCLGTLGYRHYQAPLVRFFLEQTLVDGELPNVRDSVLNYFVFAVLDKRERRKLLKFAFLNYRPQEEFVWCPKKIQRLWLEPAHGLPYSRCWDQEQKPRDDVADIQQQSLRNKPSTTVINLV